MSKVLRLAAREIVFERAALSPPETAMAEGDVQPEGLFRRGKRPARQTRRVSRSRAKWRALLVGALLGLMGNLAGCGATSVANPPASTLDIRVSVFDHESASRTPSDTTLLAITLTRFTSSGFVRSSETVQGTDAETLVCGGISLHFVDANSLSTPNAGSYVGSLPPQTGAYVCTYSWNQGTQRATLTIPVELPSLPRIQSPASRATLAVPAPGERGVTLTYANAGSSGAQVVAAADDFNKRTASSDARDDVGSVTIDPQKFPQAFSVGWGTLSLTRSITGVDISTANAAFASARLTTYEQLDQIPVFWV